MEIKNERGKDTILIPESLMDLSVEEINRRKHNIIKCLNNNPDPEIEVFLKERLIILDLLQIS